MFVTPACKREKAPDLCRRAPVEEDVCLPITSAKCRETRPGVCQTVHTRAELCQHRAVQECSSPLCWRGCGRGCWGSCCRGASLGGQGGILRLAGALEVTGAYASGPGCMARVWGRCKSGRLEGCQRFAVHRASWSRVKCPSGGASSASTCQGRRTCSPQGQGAGVPGAGRVRGLVTALLGGCQWRTPSLCPCTSPGMAAARIWGRNIGHSNA